MYRDSDSDEDCASSRREWRNERAPMAGPPEGPPLCEAGAPIEQASGDGENLMAGPPVEPPSHPDDEEPGARGPAQPGDGPLRNRRRSPPSFCPFPNCAERTHKLRDHVTLCHLHPVFRRSGIFPGSRKITLICLILKAIISKCQIIKLEKALSKLNDLISLHIFGKKF